MSKTRFTEADIRRAIKGVLTTSATVASVESGLRDAYLVIVKEEDDDTSSGVDPEDDPEVSRRLL
jgi:hypothetical protein